MRKCFLFSLICISTKIFAANIYFNKTVDTTFATETVAQGNVDLGHKLACRIGNAQYSIDFCFYDIEDNEVKDSLISVFNNKGVSVRVITDNDNRENEQVNELENAGIPVIDDSYGGHPGWSYLMHNKFAIFDFRDSTLISDDWIWTGSYNVTNNGTEKNANNAIEIQDHELARAYTMEFEEMWGSSTNTPDSINACFHNNKTDNTPHSFVVDSIPIELYFCPTDEATEKIVNAINTADHEIYFCIFSFSRQDISDSMKILWDAKQLNTTVRGVFDASYWNMWWSKSKDMRGIIVDTLGDTNNPWDPPAPVFKDSVSNNGKLHHKYMIIDVEHPDSDPIVITGSQNWSDVAENGNDENTLIIYSGDIANQYFQEFSARYEESGGSGCSEDCSPLSLCFHIYPSIFNQETTIKYALPRRERVSLKIYDIVGRLIMTLVKGEKKAGNHTLSLNTKGFAEGIYFARFVAGNFIRTKKLVVIH
ncbi:T9SS type A sorting domain-containing protein [candidate division WOR-3 bacterium]|nr:T9SS type A sorting domain-containing protein [candidate division WOR-3 bacterium]